MSKRILITTLTIICMISIFILSSMNASESGHKSLKIVETIIKQTNNVMHKIGATDKLLTDKEVQSIAKKMNNPFRKFSHAFIYFTLAILIFLTLKSFNVKTSRIIFITILICFTYSLTDEYHQTFIKGRSGEFRDCIIDTIGSTIGVAICILINKISTRKRNKNVTKT